MNKKSSESYSKGKKADILFDLGRSYMARYANGAITEDASQKDPTTSNYTEIFGEAREDEKEVKKLQNAEDAFNKAIDLYKIRYGANHSNVAIALERIGQIRFYLGKLEEAEEYYLKVLKMYRSRKMPQNIAKSAVRRATLYPHLYPHFYSY